MKSMTVTINQYEIGDILDVSEVKWNTGYKRRSMSDARKAMIMAINQLTSGECTYKAITDTGKSVLIIPAEQGATKYVGHSDIDMFVN